MGFFGGLDEGFTQGFGRAWSKAEENRRKKEEREQYEKDRAHGEQRQNQIVMRSENRAALHEQRESEERRRAARVRADSQAEDRAHKKAMLGLQERELGVTAGRERRTAEVGADIENRKALGRLLRQRNPATGKAWTRAELDAAYPVFRGKKEIFGEDKARVSSEDRARGALFRGNQAARAQWLQNYHAQLKKAAEFAFEPEQQQDLQRRAFAGAQFVELLNEQDAAQVTDPNRVAHMLSLGSQVLGVPEDQVASMLNQGGADTFFDQLGALEEE